MYGSGKLLLSDPSTLQLWADAHRIEMRLHYGRPDPIDFELLLHQMPDSEFGNLTRSTIPSLAHWRDPATAIQAIVTALQIISPMEGQLCFEYPVKSLPSNKPSFTDVMYISPEVAVGFEAKSTEPRYPTVEDWLRQGGRSANRSAVLAHWKTLIRKRTESIVDDELSTIPYQMIHRAASVCSVQARRHALVYQLHIVDAKTDVDHYKSDLQQLSRAIAAPGYIDFLLQTIALSRTPAYYETERVIENTHPSQRPMVIREALLRRQLFSVVQQHLEPIA